MAHVVHPAHVPLQVEAQTADAVGPHRVGGLGHQGPGGGLLRHHQHVGVDGEGGLVQLLEEGDGLQVLLAAVLVGNPLPVPAVVVQIQHGRHGVHADAVDVVLPEPEGGGGEQEALNLAAPVVKDPGAPGGVLPLAPVGVLVAGGAVELVEPVGVLAEVGGHPVEDDADAGLVHVVHEVHEVLGRAVPGGGGEVAGALIAPAGVVGVLGDGQQLDEVEAHLLDVGGQLPGQAAVVEEVPVLPALPGAQVDLINIQRRGIDGMVMAAFPPGIVRPVIAVDGVELACGAGAGFGVEGVGIGLQPEDAVRAGDGELVGVVGPAAGNEALPDAIGNLGHRMGVGIPGIEITHHGNGLCPRRPDAEHIAGDSVVGDRVGAHVFIGADSCSFVEEVGIQFVCFSVGHCVILHCIMSVGTPPGIYSSGYAVFIIPHGLTQRQGGGKEFFHGKSDKKTKRIPSILPKADEAGRSGLCIFARIRLFSCKRFPQNLWKSVYFRELK